MLLKLKSTGMKFVESASGATVILDDGTERYFSTNSAGSLLWRELQGGTTPTELVETILNVFEDVDRQQAERDVRDFIDHLVRFDLLADT